MRDPVIDALTDLVEAMQRSSRRIEEVVRKAEELSDQRERGGTWTEIVRDEDRPMVIELIGQNLDDLYTAGGRLRRSLARALHEEGLSMEQIARLFGVTRQRVSALLRGEHEDAAIVPQIVESGQSA